MGRPVTFLDVFAERPLEGNGVAVVAEADGVSDAAMLSFARETRLSETTYLQTAEADAADYRNRIWTPGEELPFAGHPSLGTAVAVARRNGAREASYVQQTIAGLQPIDVRAEHDEGEPERWRASMLQEPAEFGAEPDPAEAMRCVGLEPADAHPELPPLVGSTGVRHLLAPLRDASSLARVEPDYPAIDALLAPHDAVVIYLAWADPGSCAGRARAFSRILGLGEDPGTGSAVGPLCAYLAERTGMSELVISQGTEMGRPCTLEAAMEGDRVRVSGSVIPVIDGTVELPGG